MAMSQPVYGVVDQKACLHTVIIVMGKKKADEFAKVAAEGSGPDSTVPNELRWETSLSHMTRVPTESRSRRMAQRFPTALATPGEIRGREGRLVFPLFFPLSILLSLCLADLGAGERGAPLGPIISVRDRICSRKIPLLSVMAAASRCHGPSGRM